MWWKGMKSKTAAIVVTAVVCWSSAPSLLRASWGVSRGLSGSRRRCGCISSWRKSTSIPNNQI